MAYLEKGTKAPEFELLDQNGKSHTLSEYKGKKLVLYFYPKDNTSGCTREAIGFEAMREQLKKLNTVVVGVSADSVDSHKNFACKQNLNFTLLSDPEHKALEPYGIWQLKKNYGKEYMGIVRTTYLIGEDSTVEKVWKVAKVDGHMESVLKYLESL